MPTFHCPASMQCTHTTTTQHTTKIRWPLTWTTISHRIMAVQQWFNYHWKDKEKTNNSLIEITTIRALSEEIWDYDAQCHSDVIAGKERVNSATRVTWYVLGGVSRQKIRCQLSKFWIRSFENLGVGVAQGLFQEDNSIRSLTPWIEVWKSA